MSPTTYTYDNGAQETFNLARGPQTPEGYVVASFKYSDGEVSDGYVSLEWLRNRLDELYPVVSSDRRAEGWRSRALKAEQSRPLSPDDITDEMVERARSAWVGGNANLTPEGFLREVLTAALTEPASRPENAEDIQTKVEEWLMTPEGGTLDASQAQSLADFLAEGGYQFVPDLSKNCGLGPCNLNDGHSGSCIM